MPVLHLKVVGKVQGVGFRWFVRERAVELGVSGWVKNVSDGDVEVAASADADRLASLESAIKRGPAGSHVERVDHVPPPPGTKYPSPFSIER